MDLIERIQKIVSIEGLSELDVNLEKAKKFTEDIGPYASGYC